MRSARRGGPVRVGLVAAFAMRAGLAEAALPPQYERAREFAAVIDEATRQFGSQPIDAVERLTENEYRVRAGPCVVDIRIVVPTEPGSAPGPRAISVVAAEPRCR